MTFTSLPPDEVERRRLASVAVMKERSRTEFDAWYQKECDSLYWKIGKCCAGCDHWASEGGWSGECDANGIMSGRDVAKSIGMLASSYIPDPGFPYTRADHVCGLFKDDFDWSTLDVGYLREICAIRHGILRSKP